MNLHRCSQHTCFAGSHPFVYINLSLLQHLHPSYTTLPPHHTRSPPTSFFNSFHPHTTTNINTRQLHKATMADRPINLGLNILDRGKGKAPATHLDQHNDMSSPINRSREQSGKTQDPIPGVTSNKH